MIPHEGMDRPMNTSHEGGEELVRRLVEAAIAFSDPRDDDNNLNHAELLHQAATYIETHLRSLPAEEGELLRRLDEDILYLSGEMWSNGALKPTLKNVREARALITTIISDRAALKSLPAEEWNRAMTQAIAVIQAEYERVLSKQYPDADGLAFTDTVNLNIRMATVLLPELMKKIDALKRPTTSDAGEK